MKIDDALRGVSRIFLDTAPVIYYVEKHPDHQSASIELFNRIDNGLLTAVTSPVTLAECLVAPKRLGLANLEQDFVDLIVHGRNTSFVPIDAVSSRQAAEMRVRYNLSLLDALQVSVALASGCEAFLTNDLLLTRVPDLRVLIVSHLEA